MTDSPHTGDHTQSEAPSASPYIRLPLPVVAAAIFVLLAALLAFGLYANANLRPRGVIMPTPVVAAGFASATPTAQPTLAPAPTAPAVGARPKPANGVSTPAPTPVAESATVAPTPLVVPPVVAATATPVPTQVPPGALPTPLPTVEPTLAAEVGQAYESFWRVRSHAELTLDASHAPDVMVDGYLDRFLQALHELEGQGRAINTHVMLNYTVVQVDGQFAYVHDRIVDTSYYVDPTTDLPLTDPSNDEFLIEFTLTKSDGRWKVVDGVTQE